MTTIFDLLDKIHKFIECDRVAIFREADPSVFVLRVDRPNNVVLNYRFTRQEFEHFTGDLSDVFIKKLINMKKKYVVLLHTHARLHHRKDWINYASV